MLGTMAHHQARNASVLSCWQPDLRAGKVSGRSLQSRSANLSTIVPGEGRSRHRPHAPPAEAPRRAGTSTRQPRRQPRAEGRIRPLGSGGLGYPGIQLPFGEWGGDRGESCLAFQQHGVEPLGIHFRHRSQQTLGVWVVRRGEDLVA